MTDNQANLSYQDILDKYAESISSKDNSHIPDEKIKPEPELEPINPPEPILTPEEEEVVKSQPQAEISQPELIPEPSISPEVKPEAQPQIEAPPTPEAISPPPVAEAIIPPTTQIELPPESSEILPKKENHFFKYLFFFSLIIFIIVLTLVIISFLNSQKPISNSRDIPNNNISPTSLPVTFCEINDQKHAVGTNFPANDGCNTCTCGEDLTIDCTTNTCDATPSVKLSPTKSATSTPSAKPSTSTLKSQVEDWKTYTKSSENLSWDKCEGESTASASLKNIVSKNSIFTKTIEGVKLVYSLKSNFTAEDISKFVMCQAGGEYPIKIIEDKILWVSACSTGVAPDNPKCEDTLTAIKKLYGYVK